MEIREVKQDFPPLVTINHNQNLISKQREMVELNYLNQLPLGGFSYDNCIRNTALMANTKAGTKMSYTKTGTTICGVVFNVSANFWSSRVMISRER